MYGEQRFSVLKNGINITNELFMATLLESRGYLSHKFLFFVRTALITMHSIENKTQGYTGASGCSLQGFRQSIYFRRQISTAGRRSPEDSLGVCGRGHCLRR